MERKRESDAVGASPFAIVFTVIFKCHLADSHGAVPWVWTPQERHMPYREPDARPAFFFLQMLIQK